MSDFSYIKENLVNLRRELCELSVGGECPTLVCVTKSASDEELLYLASLGEVHIAENRPSETKRRYELLRAHGYSPMMHQIGTLQRNKVKLLADIVYAIHSLDTERLAMDISKRATELSRKIPVLIEVNSAREEQKGGVNPECVEEFLLKVRELPGISVCGLMTMGPVCDNPEELRPYFKETRALFDRLKERYGFGENPILSMGMSDSYRVAIEEGATLVRIGRRLFIKETDRNV